MHPSRGFIDFRADQRRPPGSARNDVFSRQSESPDKHDVPSNLSEAVQRAVRMRDRIENRYERSKSQVRTRSRERVRSRSRNASSRTRSVRRSRSKSPGRARSRSRVRSATRSPSRGRSRGTSPRFRSRSRGRTGFAQREQSPARFRRSVSRGRSPDRSRSPGRYRRNGRVSRFEPQESRDDSQSRSIMSPDASSFAGRSFPAGALSRFESPPSPKIESLSPGPLEERPSTEDLYDGVVNDGIRSPTPSGVFLNPTFRPIHSPRKDRSRSPKLLSPVNAIYPDVPAEVPQDVLSKALPGSSPNRSTVAEERYREILVLRESLRLAEERHVLESRKEAFPRSHLPEPTAHERDAFERRQSRPGVLDRLDYREEYDLRDGLRRSSNSDSALKGPEGYERRSPSEKSRQDLSEGALVDSEKELAYGRIPPRRSDPQSTRSRPALAADVDLALMQQSIEQLRRQIQEKEAAARNVRTSSYIERNLSRNEDTPGSARSGSSLRDFDRRNFQPEARSPESSYPRVQDAPLNRELFSRRSRSPYGRRTPSPYERRSNAQWPTKNQPPAAQLQHAPGPPGPSGPPGGEPLPGRDSYGPNGRPLPAFLNDANELQNILYRANHPEQFNNVHNPPHPQFAPPHDMPGDRHPHNVAPNRHPPNTPPAQHPLNIPPGQHQHNMPPGQPPHNMPPGQPPHNMMPNQHHPSMPPGQLHPNTLPGQHHPNMPPGQHHPNMPPGQHHPHMIPGQHHPNMPPGQHHPNMQHPLNILPPHPLHYMQLNHNVGPFKPQADPQIPFHSNPIIAFDFGQRSVPAGQNQGPHTSAQGRDRSNLKTLTGSSGAAARAPDVPNVANNNATKTNKKRNNKKKKAEASGDAPNIGAVEIGSDMEIDEEDVTSKDVSDKPEEKYAEEIKSYLRLTQRKDSEKERLVALKSEMSRISKLQADLLCLRKKFPEDPMLGRQLTNAAKLYEEAKKRAQGVHSQSESLNQDIFKIPQKIKLLAMEHEALFRDKIAPPPGKAGAKSAASAKDNAFKYVDRGDYFCSFCKLEFRSVSAILSHLHTNPHVLSSKQTLDRPWASTETHSKSAAQAKIAPSKIPAKGAQFLMGVQGFYCRLCKSMFPDNQLAEDHILSESHNQKYKEYIGMNPFYERRVQLEKEILVHTVSAATAPRPLASNTKSPSQPPGVETELDKTVAVKPSHEDSHKTVSSESKFEHDTRESNVNPVKTLSSAQSEKKIPGTPVAPSVSMLVSPKSKGLPMKTSGYSQKGGGGGIRLKLLKSTSSSQPLIVGKAPFRRKSQDAQESPSPQDTVSPSPTTFEEKPFVPSDEEEELEEF